MNASASPSHPPAPAPLPVEVVGLTKHFGAVAALDGVDLVLRPGDVLGLVGKNGAGKTTLIHILLGLLSPTGGSIRIFGLCPLRHRPQIARLLNFASAYTTMPGNLTVREVMRIFAGLYDVKEPREVIAGLLDRFGIAPLANRVIGALSSGEKARLNLCKALLNTPRLLLLDEPTASLDPEMADTVRSVLVSLLQDRRMAMIYTTHNMHEIERICTRVQFLHQGRTLLEGTPQEVPGRYGCATLEEVFIHLIRTHPPREEKP